MALKQSPQRINQDNNYFYCNIVVYKFKPSGYVSVCNAYLQERGREKEHHKVFGNEYGKSVDLNNHS